MFNKQRLSIALIALVLPLFAKLLFAWTIETHQLLSDQAAIFSNLQNGVLQGLDFQDLDTVITGTDYEGIEKSQEIRLWIEDGAKFEDSGSLIGYLSGTARALNHFHNPLHQFNDPQRFWLNAGLDDYAFGLQFTGDSSLLWAQSRGNKTNPVWYWQGVRGAYYQALTLPARADREVQFARVFEGLGHLIHLIEDMAQPDHVRNDAHPADDRLFGYLPGLEHWVRVNADDGDRNNDNDVTDFAANHVIPPPSLTLNRVGTLGDGYEPITNFWDTDAYTGAFQVTGTDVGLAEYTNANFFSEDTINASNPSHQFPYPSVDIQNYHTCTDDPPPNSLALKRWYISRTECPPQSPRVDHFLAQSLLRDVFNQQPVAITAALQMDDMVREDYARDLIPRSVGYSAALIFHNPLYQFNDPQRPWLNAGLDDYAVGLHFTGDSSLLWAQSRGNKTNPVWSWQGVRGAYYQALTLPAKTDREAQFARVFEGLCHLTHLIEDMAQPDHVRNDAHTGDFV